MQIIEIQPLDNGAHRNQTGSMTTVPDGWAVIPADMTIPATFPFVDITVEGGVITALTANQDAYDAAMTEAENTPTEPTTEERLDTLEAALAQTDEVAIELYEAAEEQAEINAAQDEALIEIYEMLEV